MKWETSDALTEDEDVPSPIGEEDVEWLRIDLGCTSGRAADRGRTSHKLDLAHLRRSPAKPKTPATRGMGGRIDETRLCIKNAALVASCLR